MATDTGERFKLLVLGGISMMSGQSTWDSWLRKEKQVAWKSKKNELLRGRGLWRQLAVMIVTKTSQWNMAPQVKLGSSRNFDSLGETFSYSSKLHVSKTSTCLILTIWRQKRDHPAEMLWDLHWSWITGTGKGFKAPGGINVDWK